MTKNLLSALALVLAASCAKSDVPIQSEERASQALQALSVRDEERVARCNESADVCTQHVSSLGAEPCTRLAEHCTDLQQRLEEVRSPAVGCWRAVQECAAHTPEQAQCRRDPAECESTEDQVDVERDPVVACSERVEACLVRVAELPAAAAVSCDNIAAACERAAKGGPDAGPGSDDEQDDTGQDDAESEDDSDDGAGSRGRSAP
jgi:hypothetical protein